MTTLRRIIVAALILTFTAAAASGAIYVDKDGRQLTPQEDAELRYAEKLIQRGYRFMAGADWRKARRDFADAIAAYSSVYGEEHPRVAELYYVSGRTRLTQALEKPRRMKSLTEAVEDFRRAVTIYEALPPEQQQPLLEAYITYGDTLMLDDQPEEANATYLTAYRMIEESSDRRAANDFFRTTFSLRDTDPRRGRKAEEDQIVFLTFVVSSQGQVTSIEDRGSTASPELLEEMRSLLGSGRFRPRIVDGEPVSVPAFVKLRFPADGSTPIDEPVDGP